jgi:hypothetical protein
VQKHNSDQCEDFFCWKRLPLTTSAGSRICTNENEFHQDFHAHRTDAHYKTIAETKNAIAAMNEKPPQENRLAVWSAKRGSWKWYAYRSLGSHSHIVFLSPAAGKSSQPAGSMPTREQAQRHRFSHDDQRPVTQGRGTVLQLHSAAEEATSWLTHTRIQSCQFSRRWKNHLGAPA